MKRLLLFAALVVACLGLLASPAMALFCQEMQPGNAYVCPISGTKDPGMANNEWNTVDENGVVAWHDPTEAIPKGLTVWLSQTWFSPTRGTIQTIPMTDHWDISLSGPGGYAWSISGAASQAVWTPVYLFGATFPAFNKGEAPYWARDWWLVLPGQPLASGVYTGTTTETITRVITDGAFMGEEYYKHAQKTPDQTMPGTFEYGFTFTIAP